MDIDSYLSRIQVEELPRVDLAYLSTLQLAHLKTVPFENLDIHCGRDISLELGAVFEKVVVNKRGGFCYELNSLFHALLCEIGFNASIISARGTKAGGGFAPEFDHLALVVEIEGLSHLVDVGFGRFTISPLPIRMGVSLYDGVSEFQFSKSHGDYIEVSRLEDGVAVPEYIFSMVERDVSEFQHMSEYHQKSADSHFTQKKVISVLRDDGRITLSDTQLKISGRLGLHEESFEPSEFDQYLKKYFGVTI